METNTKAHQSMVSYLLITREGPPLLSECLLVSCPLTFSSYSVFVSKPLTSLAKAPEGGLLRNSVN